MRISQVTEAHLGRATAGRRAEAARLAAIRQGVLENKFKYFKITIRVLFNNETNTSGRYIARLPRSDLMNPVDVTARANDRSTNCGGVRLGAAV